MSNSIEKLSARLGFCCLLLTLVMSTGFVFLQLSMSVYYLLASLILTLSLFSTSFVAFHFQTRPKVQRERILWGLVLSPIILYIPANLVLLYLGMVELKLHDFGAYYNAAVRFLHGAPLYQTTHEVAEIKATISADMGYLYPPIFVLLFVPLTVLSPVLAGIIWDVLVLVFLLWSVSKLIATFDVNLTRTEQFLLYLGVVSFGPTVTWMKLGQVSGLLTGFLCLSGAALRTDQSELSGLFTTLGSVVKPFYATSGAHLLRDRRRFTSGVMSGIAIFALSVIIFGVDTHIEYLGVLRNGKGWETAIGPSNWHATHFNPFFILGPLKHFPRVLLVLGTASLALYSNKLETPIEYVFALGVAIIPLAGPTTNTLALNAVIPAIIVVGFYQLEKTGTFPRILIISTLLIHIHPYTIEFLAKFGPQFLPSLQLLTPALPLLQPAFYGVVLLVYYIIYNMVIFVNWW